MKNMITIEGVVGAGKTTIGKILADELGIKFFQEPYIENPFLDRFYSDKKRYSFISQMFFLNKRIEIIEAGERFEQYVTDRSAYGDYLFAKMHFKKNYMSEDEFKLYSDFWNLLTKSRELPILTIYLEISSENAVKRIKERGREYELEVDFEYWKSLNDEYSEFFSNSNDMNILKIDMNRLDIKNNKNDREYFISLVKERLQTTLE